MMISTSIIRSTGEKKWMPMKFFGRLEFLARSVIGMVEVFDANTAVRLEHGFGLFGRALLDLGILEHGFDDQVAAVGCRHSRRSA